MDENSLVFALPKISSLFKPKTAIHGIKNPSNNDQILIFQDGYINLIYCYNIKSSCYTRIDTSSNNYNICLIGTHNITNIRLLNGIKPNTIIVIGTFNKRQLFYCAFNTQQMQWKNMNTIGNYQLLQKRTKLFLLKKDINNILILTHRNKNNTSTNSDTTETYNDKISNYLLISGDNNVKQENNFVTIYKLNNDTQEPILPVLHTIDCENKIQSSQIMVLLPKRYENIKNKLISKNSNTTVINKNESSIVLNVWLLYFGGYNVFSFDRAFAELNIQFKINYNQINNNININNNCNAYVEISHKIEKNNKMWIDSIPKALETQRYIDGILTNTTCRNLYHFHACVVNFRYLVIFGGTVGTTNRYTKLNSSQGIDGVIGPSKRLCYDLKKCQWFEYNVPKNFWKILIFVDFNYHFPQSVTNDFMAIAPLNEENGVIYFIGGYCTSLRRFRKSAKMQFDIGIEWQQERLIWIAFYHPSVNNLSHFEIDKLPKVIVSKILNFLRHDCILSRLIC